MSEIIKGVSEARVDAFEFNQEGTEVPQTQGKGHSSASSISNAQGAGQAQKSTDAPKDDAAPQESKGCCATIKGWISTGWNKICEFFKNAWEYLTRCCRSSKADSSADAGDKAQAAAK